MFNKEKVGAVIASTEHELQPPATLSFYQRHFQRSLSDDPEEQKTPTNRRFTFLSRGFLISASVLCIVFIVVISALLATLYRKDRTRSHAGPVKLALLENFPDPSIVLHNGTWYAFGTNNAAGILGGAPNGTIQDYGVSNVQVATSQDFVDWTLLDSTYDPLPEVGAWSLPGFTNTTPHIPLGNVWAPAVLQRPSDGKFVLYYSSAVQNHTRTHCMGAAISNTSSPLGPYVALDTPIACPRMLGGAIDPAPFIDEDGSIYLAWKVDGNNVGHGGSCGNMVAPQVDTPIILQKMMADGVTPDGPQITILNRTDADGPLVEAPVIVRSHEGIYFLFFSSGCTRAPTYDLKYAWATNITGPYTRAKGTLLSTGDFGLKAPGSVGISEDASGKFVMALHARVTTTDGRVRAMYTAGLKFEKQTVTLV